MRLLKLVSSTLLLSTLVTACAVGAPPDTPAPATTIAPVTTLATTTTVAPSPCPPAPYELGSVPSRVESTEAGPGAAEPDPDEFTSIGGTHIRLWIDGDGEPAIALVRGSLPPQQFPAERGEAEVAGTRAVAGPYPDGRWVVAWFNEPGDRCDEYTMVFYPPVAAREVEQTLADMTRTAG